MFRYYLGLTLLSIPQVLLDLAGVIFHEQSTIDTLIFRILTHMLSLIRCERAMLLLVDENSPVSDKKQFNSRTVKSFKNG